MGNYGSNIYLSPHSKHVWTRIKWMSHLSSGRWWLCSLRTWCRTWHCNSEWDQIYYFPKAWLVLDWKPVPALTWGRCERKAEKSEKVCLLVSLCIWFVQERDLVYACMRYVWGRWVILHVSFEVPRVFFFSSFSLSRHVLPHPFCCICPPPPFFISSSLFFSVTFLSSAEGVILVFCWLCASLTHKHTHTPAVESGGVYWIVCVLYLDKEKGKRECEKERERDAEGRNDGGRGVTRDDGGKENRTEKQRRTL